MDICAELGRSARSDLCVETVKFRRERCTCVTGSSEIMGKDRKNNGKEARKRKKSKEERIEINSPTEKSPAHKKKKEKTGTNNSGRPRTENTGSAMAACSGSDSDTESSSDSLESEDEVTLRDVMEKQQAGYRNLTKMMKRSGKNRMR